MKQELERVEQVVPNIQSHAARAVESLVGSIDQAVVQVAFLADEELASQRNTAERDDGKIILAQHILGGRMLILSHLALTLKRSFCSSVQLCDSSICSFSPVITSPRYIMLVISSW